MKDYRLAFVVCLLLFVASLLVRVPGKIAQAEDAPVFKPVASRYMVSTAQVAAGSVQVTMCDTFTGECWVRATSGEWTPVGSPVAK